MKFALFLKLKVLRTISTNLLFCVLNSTNACSSFLFREEEGVGHKEYLFCSTPAKKLQKLRPAASKNLILRLRPHQDSQAAVYIDLKL